MKNLIALILGLVFIFGLAGCNTEKPVNDSDLVPEDFSFALTWNCYGVSSYDSETGNLIKTTDATDPNDYVTRYELTDADKKYIYDLISSLDINSYPDVYDPENGSSKPSMSLVLTVRINGEIKTVKSEGIALSFKSNDTKGQKFLSVCEAISTRLERTNEWNSLPEYEHLYD